MVTDEAHRRIAPRPSWLRTRVPGGESYARVRKLLGARGLHTVCDEARCPNKAECWGAGTATFLLLGDTCSRACRFCSVTHGKPPRPPDPHEGESVVEAARLLELKHVVLTSVTRDDLTDGGASHFARVVGAVRGKLPHVTVEALIPAFLDDDLRLVLAAGVDVLAHNLEVVRRLTPLVRDRRADYERSLGVLGQAKRLAPGILTKSSLLLGMGETFEEVHEALFDMRREGVDVVAMGQYLQPSSAQVGVTRYLEPSEWEALRADALRLGFAHVAAGPFVRTSFRAHEALAPLVPLPVPEVGYSRALGIMADVQREVARGGPERVMLLTHPRVITLGRMADPGNVKASMEQLARAGIEVVRTTRGGEVTFHGPGQLVAYPIIDLGRRHWGTRRYVAALLGCVERALLSLGVDAVLVDGVIGVFVRPPDGPPCKIASLGVSVSRGITGHGVAVNVTLDPSEFGLIVPCGLAGFGVTSMARVLPEAPDMGLVAARLMIELRSSFGRDLGILVRDLHGSPRDGPLW